MILNKALMLGALALTTVMSPCGGEDIVGSISDSLLLYGQWVCKTKVEKLDS
ncbi:LOW QUALITY PROTEIN: HLA-DQA1 isoform 6 [Pongo abelii]|uniref:HLA-DQA1 isoform 6 n=1 Tax=Pongo abelii TaxID=9601 RepID=A0A2J8Y2T5_PONAB|nr:LOW QUALITY PROTEIN: HLA-DQA1 isoform 6 [Pongo abelii]